MRGMKKNKNKKTTGEDVVDEEKLYAYDEDEQMNLREKRPWKKKHDYFTKVKISDVALIKMVMHAVSGGRLEVMGILQGKIEGDTMVVMDSFALPVEGTETRVNAAAECAGYMIQYMESAEQTGKPEPGLGWYHSHPGYGCWLSGIDVNTQLLNQKFQDPWLAIVVDPVRTIAQGKVQLSAFRTYPEDYKPPEGQPSQWESVPMDKVKDFGVHANRYYSMEVTYFKSNLDSSLLELLWNKYWVNTLAANPLLATQEYMVQNLTDLSNKLDGIETNLVRSGRHLSYFSAKKTKEESQLSKLSKDSTKLTLEQIQGLMSQVIKNSLFNGQFSSEKKMDTE